MTGATSGRTPTIPTIRPSIIGRAAPWAIPAAADRTAGSSAVMASRAAACSRASAAATR